MKHSPSARGILFYAALICAFLVDCSNAYDNEGQPFEANTLGHESIIHSGLRTAPSPGGRHNRTYRHRFAHFNNDTGIFTRYSYFAELHHQTIHIDDHHDGIGEVRIECHADERDANVTFVKVTFLDVGAGFSSLLSQFEDDSAQILIGNASSGCQLRGSDSGFKLRMPLDRKWTEFSNSSGNGRQVTFYATEASFHECFKESHIEFFAGHPSDFLLARSARHAGNKWNTTSDSVDELESETLFTRKLKWSGCSSSKYSSASVRGSDCTSSGSQATDCFYGTSDSSVVDGNFYTLKFYSGKSGMAKITVYEDDEWTSDDYCGSLGSKYITSGWNEIEIEWKDYSDCNDFGTNPEYYIKIVDEDDDCNAVQTGTFRVAWGARHDEVNVNFKVPSTVSFGTSTTGSIASNEDCSIDASSNIDFTCTDCSISGKSSVHVVIRTTNVNPFAETWIWGNVENLVVDMKLAIEARAAVSGRCTTIQDDKYCLPGLCYGINVASLRLQVGVFIDLWTRAVLDVHTSISYSANSKFRTSGSGYQHYIGGEFQDAKFTGFEIENLDDNAPEQTFDMTVSVDASLAVWPAFYFGIFASKSDWSSAHAYLQLDMYLAARLRINFEYGELFLADSSCNHFLCTDECAEPHDAVVKISAIVNLGASAHLEVKASLPWGSGVQVGPYDKSLNDFVDTFDDDDIKLAKLCMLWSRSSRAPAPPPALTSPSANQTKEQDNSVRAVIWICIVIGILLVLGWVFKRNQPCQRRTIINPGSSQYPTPVVLQPVHAEFAPQPYNSFATPQTHAWVTTEPVQHYPPYNPYLNPPALYPQPDLRQPQ